MPHFGIFGVQDSKTIVIFVTGAWNFPNWKISLKTNCLNLRSKMSYWDILGLEFWKAIAIFQISSLKFHKLKNFTKTQKCVSWNENAFFGYLFAKFWKKLLSCFKSAPSNLSNCKIFWRNENTYILDKNGLFQYFSPTIFKNYCHISNHHPQICLIPKFCEKKA